MTTPNPQEEFQKLAYLKALGLQPLVLVRQPVCGTILPRAVPIPSEVALVSSVSSDANAMVLESSSKQVDVSGANPTASLAAVRESLMGTQTRSDPADTQAPMVPDVQPQASEVVKTVALDTRQSDDQRIKAEEIPVPESASASTSPSPTGTVLPSKFTALVYAHAHVTLVAVGAQLQAQHWALSKNISLACHAASSSQSDAAALPSVLEFHWPIPGVPANEPEAAKSAFAGFLSKHTAQSDRRVLLLGDLSQQLAQVFVQHAADKQILAGPSLDAMLGDQSLKRLLWQDLIVNGFA